MKNIHGIYDQLPVKCRSAVRSILPKQLLRWYAHKNTDVYLISYPKCGRTWLRLMIGRAIANHFSLPQCEDILFLNWKRKPHPDIPKITIVHDDRPMLKTSDELEVSKSKYRGKSIIFLVRDPRDVLVSSYYEVTQRGHLFGDNPHEDRKMTFDGSLSDYIYTPIGGFDTILSYYNIWANNRQIPKKFLLVHYEDLHASPETQLRTVIDFIGLQVINDQTISEAVQFSSFENMRQMESDAVFNTGILSPADKSDENTYKSRKGKIGGYKDYLSETEIKFLNQKMEKELSPYFNYQPN